MAQPTPPKHPDSAVPLDDDDELVAPDPKNPYASKGRWRHQESSAYARHAAQAQPRDPEARGRTNDLANFLNKSRVDHPERATPAGASKPKDKDKDKNAAPPRSTPIMVAAPEAREAVTTVENGEADDDAVVEKAPKPAPDGRDIAVGPLLNYRRMEGGRWFGSVLVVTRGGGTTRLFEPTLRLARKGEVKGGEGEGDGEDDGDLGAAVSRAADGVNGAGPSSAAGETKMERTEVPGVCLYSDPRNTFWRFDLDVAVEEAEVAWAYTLPDLRFRSKTKPQTSVFRVPAAAESMRVMFHSCNGFSVGTDEDEWSGAALWNDVLRRHAEAPFHVMIGGGDQIYNDGIRVKGPLKTWTRIGNPRKRREYPFPESLRQECDDYYLRNYLRWYGTEPFASANGQIPQLNIWDDHDIIDGFGSYVNEFMKCDVFRGIGGTAHKYYMLFQHHLPPPPSTYTSDAPQTTKTAPGAKGVDPIQLQDTYVHERMTEPNYIVGSKPGPYVAEHSHNMFARLGARMAFLGIDARTERTRHQINYPETYDAIFTRLGDELRSAKDAGQPYKHLILLLGIPIAYPRLTWLENVFASPVMGPIKFLNRRFGLGGGIFNHFDGSVDLLDDLDDHYTARTHKKERNALVERLQTVCREHSIRITILGGDVHLAALGRFYSNPKLNIATENDFRYMANVVSSAIVNKPPPAAIANLLAHRNKIHHLNHETDETLMNLFDKDPGDNTKTANHNHVTMPARNFATITENSPNNPAPAAESTTSQEQVAVPTAPAAPTTNGTNGTTTTTAPAPTPTTNGNTTRPPTTTTTSSTSHTSGTPTGKDGHYPLHAGEQGAGTAHRAASPTRHGRANDGSLDVCIRVEVDQHDAQGRTQAYGLTIPALACEVPAPAEGAGAGGEGQHHHRAHLRRKKSGMAGTGARVETPAEA